MKKNIYIYYTYILLKRIEDNGEHLPSPWGTLFYVADTVKTMFSSKTIRRVSSVKNFEEPVDIGKGTGGGTDKKLARGAKWILENFEGIQRRH